MKIRAISLWQPWASLIATGAKHYETRSWATRYRGPLAICASKRRPDKEWEFAVDFTALQVGLAPIFGYPIDWINQAGYGVTPDHLPYGCVVAVAELADCIHIDPRMRLADQIPDIGHDTHFGNFTAGRYAWKLSNVRPTKHAPVVGRQGLFEIEI